MVVENFNVSPCFATGGVELVCLQFQQYHGAEHIQLPSVTAAQ